MFGLHKLLIIICLVSYCFIGYYHTSAGLSLGGLIVLALALFYFLRGLLQGGLALNRQQNIVLLTAISLSLLTFAVNMEIQWPKFISLVTSFIIFYVFYHVGRFDKHVNMYIWTFVGCVAISALVASLQAFDLDFAWRARQALPEATDLTVIEQIEYRLKPPGLAYYSVQLSYQLLVAAILLCFLGLSSKKKGHYWRYGNYLFIGASALAGTISSLVGIMVLYFLVRYNIKITRKILIYSVIFIALALLAYLFLQSAFEISNTKLSRLTFIFIAGLIAIENPLGVAEADMLVVKTEAMNVAYNMNLPFAEVILETSYHNTFLNILVQTGVLGLLIYVALYIYMFRFYTSLREYKDQTIATLSLIGSSGVIVYLAQCMTHNAGPFTSDPYFWIANGLMMGKINQHLVTLKISKEIKKSHDKTNYNKVSYQSS